MKGIILCGGLGTRLRPMTNFINKHLLCVYNRPMVDYPLQTLIDMGIKDIMVVSGREHAGDFLNYLGSGIDRGINLTYRVQEDAGGIAQALSITRDWAQGQTLAVILGDNYFSEPVSLPQGVGEYDFCGLILKKVPDPQRFGVACFDENGVLIGIEEKPKEPKSELAITGLYFYPPDVFDLLKTLKPSSRGEYEITDVNDYYVKQGRISYIKYSGYWRDMGQPDSLAETIAWIVQNKSQS